MSNAEFGMKKLKKDYSTMRPSTSTFKQIKNFKLEFYKK